MHPSRFLRTARRQQRVNREESAATTHQHGGRTTEQQRQLESLGREEPLPEMHDEDRAQHFDHESESHKARQEAGDQSQSAEELEQRDQRPRNGGQRDVPLGEATGYRRDAHLEELLRAVHDEPGTDHEAEQGEAELGSRRLSRGD